MNATSITNRVGLTYSEMLLVRFELILLALILYSFVSNNASNFKMLWICSIEIYSTNGRKIK